MVPVMDGREAVRHVRAMEEGRGISSTHGAKIIMTTAVTDIRDVILCYRELCDSYLMKPIDLTQLRSQYMANTHASINTVPAWTAASAWSMVASKPACFRASIAR